MKKLLKVSSVLAIGAGIILVVGGIWGIFFTYKNITQEKIVTPADATIPEKAVRGPFTLRSQVDIIRKHTLESTDGKTYAEMSRRVPMLDENGQEILDEEGNPVMTINTARNIWITATTLNTALNLSILTYVFSGLIILLGFISMWTGAVFCFLSRERLSEVISKDS